MIKNCLLCFGKECLQTPSLSRYPLNSNPGKKALLAPFLSEVRHKGKKKIFKLCCHLGRSGREYKNNSIEVARAARANVTHAAPNSAAVAQTNTLFVLQFWIKTPTKLCSRKSQLRIKTVMLSLWRWNAVIFLWKIVKVNKNRSSKLSNERKPCDFGPVQ